MKQDKSRKPGCGLGSDQRRCHTLASPRKHKTKTYQKVAGGEYAIVGMGTSAGGFSA
jgi:hypothetical protein